MRKALMLLLVAALLAPGRAAIASSNDESEHAGALANEVLDFLQASSYRAPVATTLHQQVWRSLNTRFPGLSGTAQPDTLPAAVRLARTVGHASEMDAAMTALQGIIAAMGDKEARLLGPEDLQASERAESMTGVGMQLREAPEGPVVVAPLQESPAYDAGITSGDQILQVDGMPVAGLSLPMILARIKGQSGTPVKLHIRRANGTEEDLTLVRQAVRPFHAVRVKLVNDTCYLSVRAFSDFPVKHSFSYFEDDFRQALKVTAHARKLVVDFRGAAVTDVNEFAPMYASMIQRMLSGKVTTFVQARQNLEKQEYPGKAEVPTTMPMAILVDRGTVGLTELIAGNLQASGRAIVVGAPTPGGLVQTVTQEFSASEGPVHVTISRAHILLSNQSDIVGRGLQPDVSVDAPSLPGSVFTGTHRRKTWLDLVMENQDPAFKAAITVLGRKVK